MDRFLRVSMLAVLCALPLAAAEEPQPKPDFLKPLASAQEMGETGLRIPLTLSDKVKPTDLQPGVRVLDAAVGTRRELLYQTAFAPKIEGQFLIVLPPKPALPQGTYDLKLKVLSNGKCCKPEQDLDLRIVLPAAALQAPATLVIERRIGIFSNENEPATLFLKETSGKAPLSDIAIEQVGWQAAAKATGNAWVHFEAPKRIEPGEPVRVENVHLHKAGSLPLGTTSGAAQIRSPQLAAAVPFTFEIHTRRTLTWIVLAIAFGLLAGLGLRTLLPRMIAADQARVEAIDTVNSISREIERRKDPDFQAKAKEVLKTLRDAAGQRMIPYADLDKARTAAVDALNKELSDLNARLETARGKVDQLDRLVTARRYLPVEMTEALAKAEPFLTKARASLKDGNAHAANVQLTVALDALADLPRLVPDWTTRAESLLDALTDTGRPVPSNLQEGLKASADQARALLDAIPDAGTRPETAALTAALDAVHVARANLRRLLSRLAAGLGATLASVETILQREDLRDLPAVRSLRREAEEAIGALSPAIDAPETGTQGVVEALDGFDVALSNGLLAQVTTAEAKKAVQAKLDQRAYGEAAREAVRQIDAAKKKALDEGALKGPVRGSEAKKTEEETTAPEEEAEPGAPGWDRIAAARAASIDWTPTGVPIDLSPGMIETTRTRLVQELGRITLVRTVLVATGLLLVGLTLFRERAGTWNEIAEVVLWAFGIDVTVDAFWAAAKTLKKT